MHTYIYIYIYSILFILIYAYTILGGRPKVAAAVESGGIGRIPLVGLSEGARR